MGQLTEELKKRAIAFAARYASFDPQERSLRLTEELVKKAAAAAIERVPELKGTTVEVLDTALDLRLRREDGVEVHARIEPMLLELWSDKVRVTAHVPGGLRPTHQKAIRAFLIGFLDRVLGVVEQQLKSVPGLTLENEVVVYERVLGKPLPLVSILGIDANTPRSFPLSIRDRGLVLQLGDAVPRKISIDFAALARFVKALNG